MGGYPPPPGSNPPPPPGGYPPPGPFGRPAPGYGHPGYPGYGIPEKAGFWARFAAFLIDGIIVGLFTIPAYVAVVTGPKQWESCSIDSSGNIDFDGTVQNGRCEVPTGTTWAIFAVLLIAAFVATLFYFAKLEGGTGQTLGARALGIKVVDTATGQPIGGGRAIGRYFARILSAIPCYLGFFWMLWDPEKQTWHDKLVNDVVVKV